MHRNTFVNAPSCLNRNLQLNSAPHIFLAGQISGVEGYVESAACGLLAGIFASYQLRGEQAPQPANVTALGALLTHLAEADEKNFQPMNVNYGLFPPLVLERKMKRADRRLAMAARALDALPEWWNPIAQQRAERQTGASHE